MLDIDKMPAGPELDDLLAERLGWRVIGYCGDRAIWEDEDGNNVWNGPFRPSTGWAAAGEVQSHLSGTGLRMCLIEFEHFWQCAFHGIGSRGMWGKADAAKLAICRAAYKAVEKGGA